MATSTKRSCRHFGFRMKQTMSQKWCLAFVPSSHLFHTFALRHIHTLPLYRAFGLSLNVNLHKVEDLAKDRKPTDLTEPLQLISETKKLVEGVSELMGAGPASAR